MEKKRLMLHANISHPKYRKLSFDFGLFDSKALLTKPTNFKIPSLSVQYINPTKKLQLNPSTVRNVTFSVFKFNRTTLSTTSQLHSNSIKPTSVDASNTLANDKGLNCINTVNDALIEDKEKEDPKDISQLNEEIELFHLGGKDKEEAELQLYSFKGDDNEDNNQKNYKLSSTTMNNDNYLNKEVIRPISIEKVEKAPKDGLNEANDVIANNQLECTEGDNKAPLSEINQLNLSSSDSSENEASGDKIEVIQLASSIHSIEDINNNHLSLENNNEANPNPPQESIRDAIDISIEDIENDNEEDEESLLSQLISTEPLLIYPYQITNSINILWKDYYSLNPDTYINDIIINFYLRFFEDNVNQAITDKVLIMSSYFYSVISKDDKGLMNEVLRSFSFKKKYCKADIFANDYILVPIYENLHWSLAIIVSPYKIVNLNSNAPSEDKEDSPLIVYLDSYFDSNLKCVKIFKKYLCCEYTRLSKKDSDSAILSLQAKCNLIRAVTPKMPKQSNSYDCGIFLLAYSEIFLYNPSYLIEKMKSNSIELESLFNSKHTDIKRKEIQRLIKKLRRNKTEAIEKYISNVQKRIKRIMSKG